MKKLIFSLLLNSAILSSLQLFGMNHKIPVQQISESESESSESPYKRIMKEEKIEEHPIVAKKSRFQKKKDLFVEYADIILFWISCGAAPCYFIEEKVNAINECYNKWNRNLPKNV